MGTPTTIHAETLGMIAHQKGMKAAPGADPQMNDALDEVGPISREGNILMRAWLTGWHKANLKSAAGA